MARYGQVFKDRAAARLLPPESAALEAVAREAWNVSKSAHGQWRMSRTAALSLALPAKFFSGLGLPPLAPASV